MAWRLGATSATAHTRLLIPREILKLENISPKMYDDDHVSADGLTPSRLPAHQLLQGRTTSYILSITGILVDVRRNI